MITHPGQREALTDVRQRLDDLRRQRKQARDQRDTARDAFAASPNDHDGNVTESPLFRRAERAVAEVQRVEADIALAESEEQNLLRGLGGNGAGNALVGRDSPMQDSLEELRQRAATPKPIGDMGLGMIVSREDWVARHGQVAAADWRVDTDRTSRFAVNELDTPPTAPSRSRFYGIIPQIRRPLTLLDVINQQVMDTGTFEYSRQGGTQTTAAEKAEGAVAAQADIALTDATCTAKTISHYLKVRREQMADVDTLATTLNTHLVFGVNLRVEGQVLSGNGIGENLTGILNTSGIGAPASGAGDSVNTDLVANAIGTVMAVGAVPTAVVLNPADAIKMAKVKASTSGVRLDSQGAFASALLSELWGVATVLNLGIPAGTALAGDWTLGATLFVREGVNVRVGEESDDLIRGRETLYASGRFGLAVWNAAAFAKVTLGFAA